MLKFPGFSFLFIQPIFSFSMLKKVQQTAQYNLCHTADICSNNFDLGNLRCMVLPMVHGQVIVGNLLAEDDAL